MDEETTVGGGPSHFLPLAVGLVGLVLGAAALMFAINAARRAGNIETTFSERIDRAAGVSVQMADLNKKLEDVVRELESTKSVNTTGVQRLRGDTENAVTMLRNYINENRSLIAKNQEAIKELANRSTAPAQTAAPSTSGQNRQQPTQTAEAPAGEFIKYSVKPGENFSIIAKKYGKTLSEIEKANPGVDSRRLQIGQEINIPK